VSITLLFHLVHFPLFHYLFNNQLLTYFSVYVGMFSCINIIRKSVGYYFFSLCIPKKCNI